jgi:cobalt-zinc-cadmium efflux system outer membrane protein
MCVRGLAGLALTLVALTPAVADERGSSYSLEQLRVIARSVHPTLDAAEAAVEASSGILRQSQAYPNPEFSLGFGRGRPREGGDSKWENQIQFVQPIEMAGIRRWRSRLAEARLRAVEVDRVLAGTVVDSTVARLAYTVLLEERRTEIARESVEVARRLQELLASRAEIGESSPLEVARARTEWFARRRDLLDAEGATEAARSALRLFCGGRLAGDYRIAETLQDSQAVDLPAQLVDRLRDRNPLLLRAGIAVEEAQARTEVARKEVFPVIELSAGYEKELDREAGGAAVGLTIPLWNRNRGAILAATAQQSVASAEVRALALELEASLEQAGAAYRRALGAIRLHQEGWTSAARRSLDVVTFSFENGEASLLDVLDAQRSYLSVGLTEAESWAGLALARADIERLTAGPLVSEGNDEHR